jgi:Arc/MetJ family transcription regulator
MKTTLDIPVLLLDEAMRLTGAKTKRKAVLTALDDFTRRAKMKILAQKLGDSNTFMTSDKLMALRAMETPNDAR